jgi:hypothetical protein
MDFREHLDQMLLSLVDSENGDLDWKEAGKDAVQSSVYELFSSFHNIFLRFLNLFLDLSQCFFSTPG